MRRRIPYTMAALLALALAPQGVQAGRFKIDPKIKVDPKVKVDVPTRVRTTTRTTGRVDVPTRTTTRTSVDAPTTTKRSTVWSTSDGTVRARDASGNLVEHKPITGANASRVYGSDKVTSQWMNADGRIHQRLSDGSKVVIDANGTRVRTFNNGITHRFDPDGTMVRTNGIGQKTLVGPSGRAVVDGGPKPKLPGDVPAQPKASGDVGAPSRTAGDVSGSRVRSPGELTGRNSDAAAAVKPALGPGESIAGVKNARVTLADGRTVDVNVPAGKSIDAVVREQFGNARVVSMDRVQYRARTANGGLRDLPAVVTGEGGYRIRPGSYAKGGPRAGGDANVRPSGDVAGGTPKASVGDAPVEAGATPKPKWSKTRTLVTFGAGVGAGYVFTRMNGGTGGGTGSNGGVNDPGGTGNGNATGTGTGSGAPTDSTLGPGSGNPNGNGSSIPGPDGTGTGNAPSWDGLVDRNGQRRSGTGDQDQSRDQDFSRGDTFRRPTGVGNLDGRSFFQN